MGPWLSRFRQRGLEGLVDAPRSGRPADIGEAQRRRVLLAPLASGARGASSRAVAEAAGVSQSAVVRLWAADAAQAQTDLRGALPDAQLTISAWVRAAEGSAVFLLTTGQPLAPEVLQGRRESFMRSPLRRSLQVLLATELVSPAQAAQEVDGWSDACAADADVVLCSTADAAEIVRRRRPNLRPVVVDERTWQGMAREVGIRLSMDASSFLSPAQRRAMEWARSPRGSFLWRAPALRSATPADTAAATGPRSSPPATSETVAAAITARLTDDLLSGRLAGGDHIPETQLARALHTSRGHVREALRVLASQGLIDLQPNRGAVIPVPDMSDVLETYAARRALGALIVRRATESPRPGQHEAMQKAHERMKEIARSADAWATGDADLDFQDAMARNSDMRRVSRMFLGLTVQLRLYVAVMGVRYAYSVPDMVRDNSQLLDRIAAGASGPALAAWDSKMRDAAQYMLGQLSP